MKPLREFISAILIALVFFVIQSARAQLLYEPFPSSYGDGTPITSSPASTVWSIGNGAGGGSITNSGAAALSYSGLQTSAGSLGAWMSLAPASGGNRNRAALFTATSSGTLYASFLLNIQSAPSADRLIAGLSQTNASTSITTASEGVWLNSSSQLMISKYSSGVPETGTTSALGAGTHLIVMRYTFNGGANDDSYELWLDPGSLGVSEGSVPLSNLSDSTGNDVTVLRSFWLIKMSSGSGLAATDLYFDEIRVGTTWADVTPTAVPEPSTVAILGIAAMGLIACYRRARS